MTEEAKKNLLDYMLGKMPSESGVDEPQFGNYYYITNNFYSEMSKKGYDNISFGGYLFNENNSNFVLWGNNSVKDDDKGYKYGVIIIFDENFQVLSIIDSFDTGTKFRCLTALNIDEEGNYYGIDEEPLQYSDNGNTSNEDYNYRVILLNNISQAVNEEYSVILRNSYYIPSDYSSIRILDTIVDSCGQAIQKIVDESTYVIAGVQDTINKFITFKINVGSDNEWNLYSSTAPAFISPLEFVCESDENNINIYGYGALQQHQVIEFSVLNSTFTYNQIHDVGLNGYLENLVMVNKETVYFTTFNSQDSTYIDKLFYYNNGQMTQLFEKTTPDFYMGAYNYLFLKGNNVFLLRTVYNNPDDLQELDLYVGMALETKYYDKYITKIDSNNIWIRGLFVLSAFNLNRCCIQERTTNQMLVIPLIFNESNYNGDSFTDKNSLNSNSAILYSNNNPVFARNLYNKTQNGATTTSTIEIPNNYLNDTLVDQKDLMSVNNNVIINDTNGFTKNIYETVYLNFVNTISVVNQNETQPIYNNMVATKLNTSINNSTDYDDLKLTKYRINYQDGTNSVSTLQATLQDDGSYELLMTFYLSKLADTLELISEDEQTVYLTYNLANTEINKYYSFKQRVRIGGN